MFKFKKYYKIICLLICVLSVCRGVEKVRAFGNPPELENPRIEFRMENTKDFKYKIKIKNLYEDAKVEYKIPNKPDFDVKSVVSVDKNGVLTMLTDYRSSLEIHVYVTQGEKRYKLYQYLNFADPYIVISNKTSRVDVPEKYQFKIKTVAFENPNIIWWVSDKSIATIDSKTGELTAKKSGTIKVTAKETKSGTTSTCYIEIIDPKELDKFGIENKITEYWRDVNYRFDIKGKDVSKEDVEWSSSNSDIAKVSSTGIFVAQKEGEVTITAKNKKTGVTDLCTINIRDIPETPERFFEIDSVGYIIAYKSGEYSEIKIPSVINGRKVIGIRESVFENDKTIKTVVIPATIKVLGDSSFAYCSNLETFVVLNRTEKLEFGSDYGYVLKDCKNFKNFICPYDSKLLLKNLTFGGNISLKSITLPDGTNVDSLWLFSECKGLRKFKIPYGVKDLSYESATFAQCRGIRIRIPETVTSIGMGFFNDVKEYTIITPKGSVAEKFAIENKIPYENY